ncbi:MAG: agmatinase [Flavobacteriales bacterium]|jgi:agmatinase
MNNSDFDPNGVGIANGNFFGFPNSIANAQIILFPIPWDVTTSYEGGTSKGPSTILEASIQLDFFDYDVPNAWKFSHATHPTDLEFAHKNEKARSIAEEVILALEQGKEAHHPEIIAQTATVNAACEWLKAEVKATCKSYLKEGKLIGLVGGDHSTPLGYLEALAENYESFGILQIDAHADLRHAYEGFTYSHASIMYNALQIPQISKLVQVGVRDICPEEVAFAKADVRIQQFDDFGLKHNLFCGRSWKKQCETIVAALPQLVYISFDIDGLSPELCPNTGTPVPGGLSFHEASFLLKTVMESGRKIIGFDLNEVRPGDDEWDANVGARILYKLRNLMAASQFLIS